MFIFKFLLILLLLNEDLVFSKHNDGLLANQIEKLEKTHKCLKDKLEKRLKEVTASLVQMCEKVRTECKCDNGKPDVPPKPEKIKPEITPTLIPGKGKPKVTLMVPPPIGMPNVTPMFPFFNSQPNIFPMFPFVKAKPEVTLKPTFPIVQEAKPEVTPMPMLTTSPPPPLPPKTCKEAKDRDNAKSGLVLIQPDESPESFFVYCDMERMGGGWIIFLNRIDKSQSFAENLETYKSGFGDFKKSYWLGLDHLYYLTKNGSELLVVLHDFKDRELFAHYKNFKIGSEEESYPILELSGYSGTAENSLTESLGKKFSTNDRDYSKGCSAAYGGRGWWYTDCHQMHFTRKTSEKNQAMRWLSREGPFQYAVMMVRPAN